MSLGDERVAGQRPKVFGEGRVKNGTEQMVSEGDERVITYLSG